MRFDYSLEDKAEYEQSRRFIKYLNDAIPPEKDTWRACVVNKIGNTYEVHLPIKHGMENDFLWTISMKAAAKELSATVFDSKPVEWHLCDMFFNTCRVVTQ